MALILADALGLPSQTIMCSYAKQLGVDYAVVGPGRSDFDLTSLSDWQWLKDQYTSAGLTPAVLEGMPEVVHKHIKEGDEKRDWAIDTVIKMLPCLDKIGLRTICPNWMARVGWYRTKMNIENRGGALTTGFNIDDYVPADDFAISEEKLWENLTVFLQAVVPYCEKYGIRLAFHPDDPPLSPIGPVSRILTSVANYERAMHIVESPYVGVTICQGNFALMPEGLETAIRTFGAEKKIFFVHFRNITGNKYNFRETFHDNGDIDMVQAIRLYKEYDVDAYVRVDHVPTMAGEDNDRPGYANIGRLYAIGYLKGIMETVNKE